MSHVIITGANRGIGLALAKQFADRGDQVTALCRRSSPALDALDVTVHEAFDVADGDAVDRFAASQAPGSVDLLVNNAGILDGMGLDSLDEASIRRQFEVNALGPLRVTRALLPALAPDARVALITSRMGSIGDNTSGGSYGYRMSKAALNAAGKSLAHDLKGRGISVAILHPGYVRTDMTGQNGLVDTAESARGLIERMDALTPANSGSFWHVNGDILPW